MAWLTTPKIPDSRHPELLARQKAVTRKFAELKDVPNVYFEIANEPASGPHDSPLARDVYAWHEAILQESWQQNRRCRREARHLIAYNDHYEAGRGIGPVPNIGILNVHYLPKLADALAHYGKDKLSLSTKRAGLHIRASASMATR